MSAQADVLPGTRDDVLAQSHSLLAVDVYQPFQALDQAAITRTYLQDAAQDDDQLEGELYFCPFGHATAGCLTDFSRVQPSSPTCTRSNLQS